MNGAGNGGPSAHSNAADASNAGFSHGSYAPSDMAAEVDSAAAQQMQQQIPSGMQWTHGVQQPPWPNQWPSVAHGPSLIANELLKAAGRDPEQTRSPGLSY